jgi:hypothetical protein
LIIFYLYPFQRARPATPESLSAALEEIQGKKEELYDLIAKTETGFIRNNSANRRLLKELSAQIEPRRGDLQWLVHFIYQDKIHTYICMQTCALFLPLISIRDSGYTDNQSHLTDLPTCRRWMSASELVGDMVKSSIPQAGSILFLLAMLEVHMAKSVADKRKQDAAAAKEKEAAHALASEIDDLRAQRRRLADELAANVQAMSDANQVLREQVKALGAKPQS